MRANVITKYDAQRRRDVSQHGAHLNTEACWNDILRVWALFFPLTNQRKDLLEHHFLILLCFVFRLAIDLLLFIQGFEYCNIFPPSLTFSFYLLSGLRPISALSTNKDSQCNGVSDARPKSGKSLTFHLTQGRHTPALSVSTAEFRYLSSRDLKTPVSVTKVAQ